MNSSLKQGLWLQAAEHSTQHDVDRERAFKRGWQRYRLRIMVTYAAAMTVMLALTGSLFLAHSLATEAAAVPDAPAGRTLVSITISADASSVDAGQTVQMTAEGHFSDNAVQPLTEGVSWASNESGIAVVDSVGLVTAQAPGSVTITATRETIHGDLALTVLPQPQIFLVSITLMPATATLALRQSAQLTAFGTFSDSSSGPVGVQGIWRSSDLAVAAVDGGGLVTATGTGTAEITITEAGQTGLAHIEVPVAIESLRIKPFETELQVGQSQQLEAEFVLNDGTTRPADQTIWTSSNDKVLQVDEKTGMATAVSSGPDSPPIGGSTTRAAGATATVTVQQDGFTSEATIIVIRQSEVE